MVDTFLLLGFGMERSTHQQEKLIKKMKKIPKVGGFVLKEGETPYFPFFIFVNIGNLEKKKKKFQNFSIDNYRISV